ncbi:hypothetical protein PJI17_33015, partial [Mycobacterium kansasii]
SPASYITATHSTTHPTVLIYKRTQFSVTIRTPHGNTAFFEEEIEREKSKVLPLANKPCHGELQSIAFI